MVDIILKFSLCHTRQKRLAFFECRGLSTTASVYAKAKMSTNKLSVNIKQHGSNKSVPMMYVIICFIARPSYQQGHTLQPLQVLLFQT